MGVVMGEVGWLVNVVIVIAGIDTIHKLWIGTGWVVMEVGMGGVWCRDWSEDFNKRERRR